MPSLDMFTAGQREQEAIRALLQLNPRTLPQGVTGTIAENYDRRYCTTTETLTSQRLYASVLMLFPGDTISGLVCFVSGASADATLFRLALFTADNVGGNSQGVRVFQSGSEHAQLTSTGLKFLQPTAPPFTFTVPGDDEPRPYYAALLVVASTPPTLVSMEAATFTQMDSLTGWPTPGLVLAGRQDSVPFMPSALTFTAAHGIQPWIGLV